MIPDFFTKPVKGKLLNYLRDIVMGLAPFPMENRAGLYDNSPKKLIVEEYNYDVVTRQPSKRKITWAEIVMKN